MNTIARPTSSRWLWSIVVLGGALLWALIASLSTSAWSASASVGTGAQPQSGIASTLAVTATPVSAVGKMELLTQRPVVLEASGMVAEVAVEVGDRVKSGDLLVALATRELENAIKAADMNLELAQISLDRAKEAVKPSDIAVAEANLLSAKETLTLVQAGPTKEELEAAKSGSAAAWASYNELNEGPSATELKNVQASLRLAEIDLQQAQRAYDQVAWMPDVGQTGEAAALQRATINYESAKASYDLATQAAKPSALQGALSGAQSAQGALNQLQKKPTAADLANAKANVASAQATLDKLKEGVKAGDVRAAELAVVQAQMAQEEAKRTLSNAKLTAPISGTVLEISVLAGQMASAGTAVAVLADTSKLKLVVNVEQRDISQVKVGQEAQISVYGLADKGFTGVVERIAPTSQSSGGAVTFPVTIMLTNGPAEELLPGMTATATFGQAK